MSTRPGSLIPMSPITCSSIASWTMQRFADELLCLFCSFALLFFLICFLSFKLIAILDLQIFRFLLDRRSFWYLRLVSRKNVWLDNPVLLLLDDWLEEICPELVEKDIIEDHYGHLFCLRRVLSWIRLNDFECLVCTYFHVTGWKLIGRVCIY